MKAANMPANSSPAAPAGRIWPSISGTADWPSWA